jgi:hypothetical protein
VLCGGESCAAWRQLYATQRIWPSNHIWTLLPCAVCVPKGSLRRIYQWEQVVRPVLTVVSWNEPEFRPGTV